MAWLPERGQGLQGWGSAPDLRAAPIEGLLRSIWAMRAKQQEDVQNSLAGAIQQYQRNKVADALTGQYAQEGLVPQELTGQGSMGLGAATDYIKAQQYRTYPTKIGDETYPLTQTDRVRLAIAAARQRASGAGGGQDVIQTLIDQGHLHYDQNGNLLDSSGNLYGYGAKGGPRMVAQGMQPSVTQQKAKTAEDKLYQSQSNLLLKKYNLTPEDLLTEREYGTTDLDVKGKPDPSKFQVTEVGKEAQPYVRITTSGGGTAVVPRNEFDAWHDVFHGRQGLKPPADQDIANPMPSPLPGTFQSDLASAQAAIAQGRDRAAVLKRLQDKYPDEDLSGL